MKLLGFEFSARRSESKSSREGSIDEILGRLMSVYQTVSNITVTPETAMEAPTVQAIVQAVSRRLSSLCIDVYEPGMSKGRATSKKLPNHPVATLLSAPNDRQTDVNYWLDNVSRLVRWGVFYALKGQGKTGPIRTLESQHPGNVSIEEDYSTGDYWFNVMWRGGGMRRFEKDEVHYVRGAARDGLRGDSPVYDVKEAIALEIAAERFGAAFFGNGAMPFLIFKFMTGFKGFKTEEEKKKFIDEFQEAYTGGRRFRAMTLPVGLEVSDPIAVENDKAQFLDTRKYQRTVIAAAWGVPPHLVGDLERGTFNNVEQQSIDFIQAVVMPYARMIESAMERDLLTVQDRRKGICIRFDLDEALRGDFKSRQEGLNIQRGAGIINPNEWREQLHMNPISEEDGGETYIRPGNTVISMSAEETAAAQQAAQASGLGGNPPKPQKPAAEPDPADAGDAGDPSKDLMSRVSPELRSVMQNPTFDYKTQYIEHRYLEKDLSDKVSYMKDFR